MNATQTRKIMPLIASFMMPTTVGSPPVCSLGKPEAATDCVSRPDMLTMLPYVGKGHDGGELSFGAEGSL